MLSLAINQQTIYYALYTGTTEAVDSDGLYTGDWEESYAEPVAIEASVSAARGTSDIDLFGINESYTKTVIVDDTDCPINEASILWIDANPETDEHNYEVVRVAKSLNHITYAVQKVNVGPSPTVSA